MFYAICKQKDADQPAHPRSLINVFAVHCLDSIIPLVSVSQELVALMQSSVVAASAGCIRNAMALRDPCALTLSSGAPDALGLLGLLMKEKFQRLRLENEKLEVVPEFCYLGDMLSAGGGCELAAITCCKCAWGKFHQLLPLLTNRHLPLLTRGKVYSSCVRSVMLHAAEIWAMKVDTLNRLWRNDRAMIGWICNVRAKDEVSSDSLLTKPGIQDLDVVLRTSGMRWFGHVERSTGWIAEVRKLNVVAQKRSGRPRKSWDEVLENDRKKLGVDSADPQNRSE